MSSHNLLVVSQQQVSEVILEQFKLRGGFDLGHNSNEDVFYLILWYWVVIQPVPSIQEGFLQQSLQVLTYPSHIRDVVGVWVEQQRPYHQEPDLRFVFSFE